MTGGPDTLVCPKGHTSSEADYCSECGAKISGPPPTSAQPTGGQDVSAQLCPDCGTLREQTGSAFCEVCGYNFTTGAHGELNLSASAAPPPPMASPVPELAPSPVQEPSPATVPDIAPAPAEATPQTTLRWTVLVAVDPSLGKPESPEPPSTLAPFTVDLDRAVSLIGRTNEARAIFPEIALPFDEAVSRRHALLQRSDDGALTLRDIGSANGTRLNGREVAAMVDTSLKPGDEITLGHWTRLTVGTTA